MSCCSCCPLLRPAMLISHLVSGVSLIFHPQYAKAPALRVSVSSPQSSASAPAPATATGAASTASKSGSSHEQQPQQPQPSQRPSVSQTPLPLAPAAPSTSIAVASQRFGFLNTPLSASRPLPAPASSALYLPSERKRNASWSAEATPAPSSASSSSSASSAALSSTVKSGAGSAPAQGEGMNGACALFLRVPLPRFVLWLFYILIFHFMPSINHCLPSPFSPRRRRFAFVQTPQHGSAADPGRLLVVLVCRPKDHGYSATHQSLRGPRRSTSTAAAEQRPPALALSGTLTVRLVIRLYRPTTGNWRGGCGCDLCCWCCCCCHCDHTGCGRDRSQRERVRCHPHVLKCVLCDYAPIPIMSWTL